MSRSPSGADPNRNTLWARALVEELARSGIRDVCLAPGSRSTPLVLAAHAHEELRVRVFLDERSAAFFALGIGKSTGVPAAVITTSGTAVANLFPAVVEAHQSESPLLLLTADRPHHLRDADANQAIRQPGIFGDYLREGWDLPQPRVDAESLLHLRAVANRAVASAVGDPPGAVQVNVPLRKPLEPTRVPGDVPETFAEEHPTAAAGRGSGPVVHVAPRRLAADPEALGELARALAGADRALLIVGPGPRAPQVGAAALKLAGALGIPLLSDPHAGARTLPAGGAARIDGYDLILREPRARMALRPDLILRVGAAPTSAALLASLREWAGADQWVLDGGGRWKDHQNTAARYLPGDPAATLDAITRVAQAGSSPDGQGVRDGGEDGAAPPPEGGVAARRRWCELWRALDGAARAGVGTPSVPPHEGDLAEVVVRVIPAEAGLFVSSSMPIRDVDAFGGGREDGLPVWANRGASGIDGIISTAAGTSAGSGRRVVVLLGDLAFLHDANGLLALREEDVRLTLVVVNNDGGGIFHMLPVREMDPPFSELFATPHGLDLSHLAALHGLAHRRVDGVEDALPLLEEALQEPGSQVIEIRTDREANRIGHEVAVAAAREAVRRHLGQGES